MSYSLNINNWVLFSFYRILKFNFMSKIKKNVSSLKVITLRLNKYIFNYSKYLIKTFFIQGN